MSSDSEQKPVDSKDKIGVTPSEPVINAPDFDVSSLDNLFFDDESGSLFGDMFADRKADLPESIAERRATPDPNVDPYGFAAAGADKSPFGDRTPSVRSIDPTVSPELASHAMDMGGLDEIMTDFMHDHIFEGPAPKRAPARDAAVIRATPAARRPTLRNKIVGSLPVMRLRSFWEGPLGWQAHRDDRNYVRRKMLVRYGGICVAILLVAAFISVPTIGSAYVRSEPDLSKSQALWNRGVVEYPLKDRLFALSNGSQYTVFGVRNLRAVYAGYWSAFASSVADGDTGHLSAYATTKQIDSVKDSITSLHSKTLHIVFSGPGSDPNSIVFVNAVPSGNPTEVVAQASGLTEYSTVDSSGSPIDGGYSLYSNVSVIFDLDGETWKVASIAFS